MSKEKERNRLTNTKTGNRFRILHGRRRQQQQELWWAISWLLLTFRAFWAETILLFCWWPDEVASLSEASYIDLWPCLLMKLRKNWVSGSRFGFGGYNNEKNNGLISNPNNKEQGPVCLPEVRLKIRTGLSQVLSEQENASTRIGQSRLWVDISAPRIRKDVRSCVSATRRHQCRDSRREETIVLGFQGEETSVTGF